MQASHGVEAVGDHPHALLIGQARRPFISSAMPQAHHHTALAQRRNHLPSTWQFRRQGDQGNVVFKATDAALQLGQRGRTEVLAGVGTAFLRRQKRTFQMGTQQAAAPGLVLPASLRQHS